MPTDDDPTDALYALLQAVQAAQAQENATTTTANPALPYAVSSHNSAPPSTALPNLGIVPGSTAFAGTPSPNVTVRPLHQLIPDVSTLTQDQRKLLIEQLALTSQLPHQAQTGTPTAGIGTSGAGGTTMLGGIAPSALPGWPISSAGTTSLSTVPVSGNQTQPASTPFPPGMLPFLYQPYGGNIQMLPQVQLQALQQAALQQAYPLPGTPTPITPSSRSTVSSATQQLRDNMLVRARGSSVNLTPQPFAPLAGFVIQNNNLITPQRRQPSSPSPAGSMRRPRSRPYRPPTPIIEQPVVAEPIRYVPEPTPEEAAHQREIKQRITTALNHDHQCVLQPDHSTFTSPEDVINRLLSWHVYQYPDSQPPLTELEAGVASAEHLIARATAMVDQFNEWQCAEKQRPFAHYNAIMERVLRDDMAANGNIGV